MFRSQKMNLFSFNLSKDSGWNFFNEIAQLDYLHLIDLNNEVPNQLKPFSSHFSLIEGMEKKLNSIEKTCLRFNHSIQYCEESEPYLKALQKKLEERKEEQQKQPETLFAETEEEIRSKFHIL